MDLRIENQTNETLPAEYERIINRVVLTTLRLENISPDVEIGLLLTDNTSIRLLNRRFRFIDSVTDVLSFPADDYPLGDIVISLEKAREQAKEYGHSLERELGFLVAHSMLHLLGYDHETEDLETVMCEKQELILSRSGLSR